MLKFLASLLLAPLLAGSATAGSTIDPTVPAQSTPAHPVPLNSAPVRNNFLAAYNDINNILGGFAGPVAPGSPVNLQTWVDTSASPSYVFRTWNSQNGVWVPTGTLNINTNAYFSFATSGGFLGTPPIVSSVSGGIVTYSLAKDTNFAVVGGLLALASVNSGHLLANCTSGSAESGDCTWTAFADQAIGSSNGMLPYRTGGAWSTASTGVAGHVLPFLDGANTWSAAQITYPGSSSLPSLLAGTLLRVANLDSVNSRIEIDAFGATAYHSGVRADGTAAVPTAVQTNDEITGFNAFGHNGTSVVGPNASLRMFAAQNWSVGANGTYVDIATTANGSTTLTSQMRVENDGGVTIGGAASQGAGTLNVLNGIYNNGAAPTGTGGYARAINPVFTTPNIGVATTTTINGNAISSGTGTLALGSFTVSVGGNITTAGALVQAGAFATTITSTATTNATLPAGTHTLAGLDVSQTWTTNGQFYQDGTLFLNGSTSGNLNLRAAAVSASSNLRFPAGTTDFSATGGVGQYVKQSSAGAALTVAGVLAADLPLATNAAFGAMKPDAVTITISSGVISAVGGVATNVTVGTTTVSSSTSPFCLNNNAGTLGNVNCARLDLVDQNLTGGANVTSASLGTKTTGTSTIDCGTSPLQWLINGGTFNIGAPANDSSCVVQVVNGAAAGTITLTGFSPQPTGFGDAFAIANTASGTATFTNASANITYSSTLAVGNLIYFTNSGGALPTNFTANTLYYVLSNSGTVLTVAATPGGTVITAGSAGTGTQTAHVPSTYDLSIARVNASSVALWKQVQ